MKAHLPAGITAGIDCGRNPSVEYSINAAVKKPRRFKWRYALIATGEIKLVKLGPPTRVAPAESLHSFIERHQSAGAI